ncbi:MAG TPA: tetratricopeptide repeat protein [Steroidobacteraceae bacterium]|nr:tetratricopeptide repeat protein [Steroidobacteraceae bacterium]
MPGFALATVLAVQPSSAADLKDLYFGEALYHAYQGQYFEALERLDAELAQHRRLDEPQLDSLQYHVGQAEFSVGDFELSYRMHHRAGRAIRAVLEGNVDELVRNEAAFRLARIHFQKGQMESALEALDRIDGKVPEAIRDEIEFLRANVYLAVGRPADAADVLKGLQGAKGLSGFAAYNLGIAELQAGRSKEALQQLDKAGQSKGADRATAAIADKSNMVLGRLMLESANFERAQKSFDHVHLEGPYSNQALLSAGWAYASAENYERALVPWNLLIQRDATDSAVQEAKLALPYAYAKLNAYGRAALLYDQALGSFGEEITKVDASIKSIREGRFLEALVREEIRQDKEWVVRLRALPAAPETYYLTTLMASHDFQTALQNYLDMEDLRKKLVAWQTNFDAFDDIIGLRRANYEPLLPAVDAQFRELDSQIRLRMEQRDNLEKRLQAILTAPRPDLLATADERIDLERLRKIQVALKATNDPQTAALQKRVQYLQGALSWGLRTEYHERLTQAHKHLRALNEDVAVLKARYEAFVRTRQAAVHSYVGYDLPINRLRTRVRESLQQVNTLMARQGQLIETVAINELKTRGERLERYQTQARYAVADSYDRATRLQMGGGGGR